MSYCFGCDQLPCICAEGGDGSELRHLKRQLAELHQLNEANDTVQVKLIRENHELRDELNVAMRIAAERTRERDELTEKCYTAAKLLLVASEERTKAEKERDEARAESARLREILSHADETLCDYINAHEEAARDILLNELEATLGQALAKETT